MPTPKEFLEGARKGFQESGYQPNSRTYRNDERKRCCAWGAYSLHRKVPAEDRQEIMEKFGVTSTTVSAVNHGFFGFPNTLNLPQDWYEAGLALREEFDPL